MWVLKKSLPIYSLVLSLVPTVITTPSFSWVYTNEKLLLRAIKARKALQIVSVLKVVTDGICAFIKALATNQ